MAATSTCSHCGGTFVPRALLSFNLGRKRLYRCPSCHRWTDLNAKSTRIEGPALHDMIVDEDEQLRRRIEESRLEEMP